MAVLIELYILTFLLLIGYCCCDDFLDKFNQHEYKIKNFRIELESYDKRWVNFADAKTYKVNRTTAAANMTINLKIDVDEKLLFLSQSYKFASNEYRMFPIRFQINAKKAYEANVGGLQAISNCGNIKSSTFYKNVNYYICNYVVDDTKLPPLIPLGMYKHVITSVHLNRKLTAFAIYEEFYIPTKISN